MLVTILFFIIDGMCSKRDGSGERLDGEFIANSLQMLELENDLLRALSGRTFRFLYLDELQPAFGT